MGSNNPSSAVCGYLEDEDILKSSNNQVTEGGEAEFHCQVLNCDESFSTVGGLKIHHRSIHMSKAFVCQFCGLQTYTTDSTEKDFQLHVQTFHSEDEPLKCRKCQKTSKTKLALWRHIRESHRAKKFPCLVCGFQFSRPENLKVHAQNHEASKTAPVWKCKECGKTYKIKQYLRDHVRIAHRDDGVRHKCEMCSKEFRQASVLRAHIKFVHNDEKKYECSVCQMSYKRSHHLQRHFRSNSHEFNCQLVINVDTKREEGEPKSVLEMNTAQVQQAKQKLEWTKRIGRSRKKSSTDSDEDDYDPKLLQQTEIQMADDQPRLGRKSKLQAMVKIANSFRTETETDDVSQLPKTRKKSTTVKKSEEKSGLQKSRKTSARIKRIKSKSEFSKHPEVNKPNLGSQNLDEVAIQDIVEVEEPFVYIPKPEPDVSDDDYDSSWEGSQQFNSSCDPEEDPGSSNDEADNPAIIDDLIDSNCIRSDGDISEDDESSGPAKHKYFCMYCDKGFVSLKLVQKHEVSCGEFRKSRKRPICPDCGKICKNFHDLKKHKIRHTEDRPFPCDLCPELAPYKRLRTLKNHQDSVHKGKLSYWHKYKDNIPRVPCDICGKVLSSPKNHRRHIFEMHTEGDKFPFKCQRCPKKFRRLTYLRNHTKLDHEEKARFECKICEATFDRKLKLATHLTRKRHLQKAALAAKGKLRKKVQLRMWNVVLQNVPESKAGLEMAANIMKILLPDLEVKIEDRRIGPKTKSLKRNPRPLRIFLPSVYYRKIALANSSLLKDDKTFSKVSISKDKLDKRDKKEDVELSDIETDSDTSDTETDGDTSDTETDSD